jgi:hypothetical protein
MGSDWQPVVRWSGHDDVAEVGPLQDVPSSAVTWQLVTLTKSQ